MTIQENQNSETMSSGLLDIVGKTENEIDEAFVPPEVEENIEAAKFKLNNPETITDSEGIVFDPKLHAADKEGNPSLTKLGKFRKKSGVSKADLEAAQKTNDEEMQKVVAVQNNAALASGLYIGAGTTIFGEEFLPQKGEKETLDHAFTQYFMSKDVPDIPPGLALCIALGGYAGRRFMDGGAYPQTKTRLQKIKDWAVLKIYNMKNRKKKANKNATHDSTGKKQERKNNPNTTNSKGSEK